MGKSKGKSGGSGGIIGWIFVVLLLVGCMANAVSPNSQTSNDKPQTDHVVNLSNKDDNKTRKKSFFYLQNKKNNTENQCYFTFTSLLVIIISSFFNFKTKLPSYKISIKSSFLYSISEWFTSKINSLLYSTSISGL